MIIILAYNKHEYYHKMHFESITQYDEKYKGVEGYSSRRNACGIYSLLIAETFVNGQEITVANYESILDSAVQLITKQNIQGMQGFDELLLQQKTFSGGDISFATADLLAEDPSNYQLFFPHDKERYATILLKNSTFFVICVDTQKNHFTVRDCHQQHQYDFESYETLIAHLNQRYNMDELMIIDGVPLHEFSSIEGIIVDKSMNCVFDTEFKSFNAKKEAAQCPVKEDNDESERVPTTCRSVSPSDDTDIFNTVHQFVSPKKQQKYNFNFA
jgi:hypothetical protein